MTSKIFAAAGDRPQAIVQLGFVAEPGKDEEGKPRVRMFVNLVVSVMPETPRAYRFLENVEAAGEAPLPPASDGGDAIGRRRASSS